MAANAPTEKKIEQKFLREAHKRGWLCLKQNVVGRRGYPDRLIVRQDGVHVWCEFKRPGGVLSELQKVVIQTLIDHKCHVTVAYSSEDAIAFVETV